MGPVVGRATDGPSHQLPQQTAARRNLSPPTMSSPIHRPGHGACRTAGAGLRARFALRAALAVALLAVALGSAPRVQAAWVPTPAIDTDSGVVGVGGVGLAPDGGGALVELKRDGAGTHIDVATLVDGVWQAPQRVDSGQDGSSTQPVVSVRNGGGLVVAWTNEGALYAATRASSASPLGQPTLVYGTSGNGVAVNPTLSLSVNGAAYLAFTTAAALPGASAPGGLLAGLLSPASATPSPSQLVTGPGTIRVARFDRTSWSVVSGPLNVDPSHDAGRGANRPAVVAAADGTAVVAWGEVAAGVPQVFVRRVDRDTPSAFPQQASVSGLSGHAGGTADSPSVRSQFDASFGWIVLRQEFDDGGSAHARAIARRIIGDQLGPPVAVDGLTFGAGDAATAPALSLDGRGRGFAVAGTQGSHAVVGAHLNDSSVFGPGVRIDSTANGIDPAPAVANGDFDSQLIGWQDDPGTGASVHARVASRGVLAAEAVVSTATVDPAAGLGAGMDKYGDAALGFVQGTGAGRQVLGALYANPPTAPHLRRAVVAARNGHPSFAWGPSFVDWGGPTYQVDAGVRNLGTTRGLSLTPRLRVPDGVYPFRVVALDRFGQGTPSATGRLLVDSVAPKFSIRPGGARSAGAPVTLILHVTDRAPSSGLRPVRIAWGDGAVTRGRRQASHVYGHAGSYRVRAVAADNAGNARVRELTLTIA